MIRSCCGCVVAAILLFFAVLFLTAEDPWECVLVFLVLAVIVAVGSAIVTLLFGPRR